VDTSPSPSLIDSSFSTFSDHSTSFSSEDQLILSSSSSCSTDSGGITPYCNKDIFHHNTISHHCQTLNSIIDDIVQQDSIRIHRQTKTVLIEHEQIQFSTEKLRSFMIANATYNLMQTCFGDYDKNNRFGYISQIDSYRIRQTIINNSKLNYSHDLDVEHIDISFVLRVSSWPEDIRSMYEQRIRLWPTDIEHLFDQTCFIRYKDEIPSYTYAAIEGQLVRLMSDGQIRFTSMVWNYLNSKTCGKIPFRIFKHTLFYFFEQYSSDSFISSSHISYFIHYLFNRLQIKSIPHYFNPNYNLFSENISIPIQMTSTDLRNYSIYNLPSSSMYLYHLIYLIEFQSNFMKYFHSSKTNLPQTILDIHEMVIQQLSLGVNMYKQQLNFSTVIESHSRLTLDDLYRYQEENIQIIVDYLPLIRLNEPSLVLNSYWTIFIQYFNSLFNDLFIFSTVDV
jgi:hypothetical protein